MANNQFPAIKRRLKPQQAQTCHTAVPNGKNLPIISSIEAISRIFLREGQQIDIISVSGHCMRFISEIFCEIVAGIRTVASISRIFKV